MKKFILGLIILNLLFILGCGTSESVSQKVPVEGSDVEEAIVVNEDIITKGITVEIVSDGFSPNTLTINKGESVTWIATSGRGWPASDIHPTHRSYPGSDIKKCSSGETTFDSCRTLRNGESFSFTFNEVGEWGYHDHGNPVERGIIIVK